MSIVTQGSEFLDCILLWHQGLCFLVGVVMVLVLILILVMHVKRNVIHAITSLRHGEMTRNDEK